MRTRSPFTSLFLLAAAACASGGASPAASPGVEVASTAKNRDVITQEELSDPALSAGDLYLAIQRLRPSFYHTRGKMSAVNASAGQVRAAVDGTLQDLSVLRSLRPGDVKQVLYLSETEAAVRFGTLASGGPVIVVTRK